MQSQYTIIPKKRLQDRLYCHSAHFAVRATPLDSFRCLDIKRSRAGPEWCTKICSVTQYSASREAFSKLAEARPKGQKRRPTKCNATLIIRYHSRRVSRHLSLSGRPGWRKG